jgi:ABC-2 type transport system ATP-binding protein
MIEVKSLVKLYGERKVLHGLNFSVGVGRVCGFLGPNGSGKSTTMDILAGLLGPSDGEVKICGYDVVTQTKDVKAVVGYLPDNPPLHKEMSVVDFVEYVAKLRGVKGQERKSSVDRVLTDCDVLDVADRIIGNLSKGYRQRVALCAALVHQPKVLILDEPTEGLDPNQILHIRKLIKKLASDRTVIMSSHILSEVQATCEDAIIINQGNIAATVSLTDEATKNPAYLFTFDSEIERPLQWVREKDFVANVKKFEDSERTIQVDFKADHWQKLGVKNIHALNSALVEGGFAVTGIKEHRSGLESLFFNVIKSQPNTAVVQ